ncbi:MAG: dihydroorotate dehydrogenase electron transfer subunit, partial [Clostridia bacterium]|nr:dihydroorotate dehydrogenase electron transfer subunit [Clostridia bacterium]
MSYDVFKCKLISKKEIAPNIIDVTVKSPEIAALAKPGQFLHIKCGDEIAMPLRRPISICDAEGDKLRFIFEIKGRGTKSLAFIEDELDILGPLGNPFTVSNETFQNPVVIGGGIGTYPLYKLTKALDNPTVYLGFRSKAQVTLEEDFRSVCKDVTVATDDGSYGYNGYAIELLKEKIKKDPVDIIYACGPTPMLRAVKQVAEEAGIRCQLSLEQRMGCGIGACLTCSCETKHDGTWKFMRVCKNGPVFWSTEVVL